tara:strand:- start:4021 stop:4518 length:498 start_codon:yes stop_codon:yes gene_type:complete
MRILGSLVLLSLLSGCAHLGSIDDKPGRGMISQTVELLVPTMMFPNPKQLYGALKPAYIYEIDGVRVSASQESFYLDEGKHVIKAWPWLCPRQASYSGCMIPDKAYLKEKGLKEIELILKVENNHRYWIGTQEKKYQIQSEVNGYIYPSDYQKIIIPTVIKESSW